MTVSDVVGGLIVAGVAFILGHAIGKRAGDTAGWARALRQWAPMYHAEKDRADAAERRLAGRGDA